jgi:hypothetical protein
VEYLEEGIIPLRVVTLMTGLDGVGKSTILYTKAARATRGSLPGVFDGEPVDVVIASSEDHPATVIVPRLIAAGADLDRVHIVKVRRDGLDGEIILPDDIEEVAHRVGQIAARLLIVDPLVAYMPLQVDSHKAQHVRSVMAPLARLAEDERLAVAAVVHFNGSASTEVRNRISGSRALRDAARSVLLCAVDPSDETRYVVAQDKFSFGPRPSTGRAYRIESTTIEHHEETFTTSRVVWLGEVVVDTRSLLAGPAPAEERTERDIARDVILDALTEGDRPWADLLELARDEGASEATARRARNDLKSGGRIDKVPGKWLWTLKNNLLTFPQREGGEQINKPALTGGNTPPNLQLAQRLDGEQISQIGEQVDPLDRAVEVVGSVFGETTEETIICDYCTRPAESYTPTGIPVCGDCGKAS